MRNFIRKFTQIILSFVVSFTFLGVFATFSTSPASALSAQEGAEVARADDMPADLIGTSGILNKFTNIALYAVGFISVIMLIWGGLRYILSGGDNKKITDAKNTILYALLGLVIAFLAYAIVNFVLGTISTATSGETAAPASTENSADTSLFIDAISV